MFEGVFGNSDGIFDFIKELFSPENIETKTDLNIAQVQVRMKGQRE